MPEDYDYLFAKSKLDKNIIDLSIGENELLRNEVIKTYDLKSISFEHLPHIFEYAPPYGYEPLVDELEDMYSGQIIIGNGAKHLLSSAFYAMKATGKEKIHLSKPYWASFPSMITRENLDYSEFVDGCDCQLLVSPNNPDGNFDLNTIKNIPVIHDAAYYTHSYVNRCGYLKPIGDIQIFSMSKMLGLSGCRLGFAVIYNPIYYQHMVKYIEATTAGISTVSQAVLLHIIKQRFEKANKIIEYEDYVRKYIVNNRKYLMHYLDNNKFEISNYDKDFQNGMFAWIGSKVQDFRSVGVNIVGGTPFGDPTKIRINLAVEFGKIIKAVDKMNNFK